MATLTTDAGASHLFWVLSDGVVVPIAAVTDLPFVPLGHQTVVVPAAATTLAALLTAAAGQIAAVPLGARTVVIWPISGDIVYTLDSSTPVKALDQTARGLPIFQDQQKSWRLPDAAAIAAIKLVSSGSVAVSLAFGG